MNPLRTGVAIALICPYLASLPVVLAQTIYLGTDAYRLAPRTALVIGVSEVGPDSAFGPLANPVKDAIAITKALRDLNFRVIAPHESYGPSEMTRRNIKLALYDFAQILRSSGGVGLIYFSGHGVQRADQIYLAPYGTYVRYDRDLEEEMLSIRLFYDAFKYAGNKLNFVIVDACRNNPWDKSLEAFGEPVVSGSAQELATVIRATATLSGMKAQDGTELSPYASAFVGSLGKQDTELGRFFGDDVPDRVARLVKNAQTPTVLFAGSHDFIFHPSRLSFDREYTIYKNAMNTGNRSALEQLTTKFAGGYFVRAAQSALDNSQLAPTTEVASAIGDAYVYLMQNELSPLVEVKQRGDMVQVLDQGERQQNADWASVDLFSRPGKGWVKWRNLRTIVPQVAEVVPLQFHASDKVGFEALKADAAAKLTKAVGHATGSGTLELVSYVPDDQTRGNDAGVALVRQSNVLQAIKDAGFDASRVRLVERTTKESKQVGTIELVRSEPVLAGGDLDVRLPRSVRTIR